MTVKQAAEGALFRVLGEQRGAQAVNIYRGLSVRATYLLHPRARGSRKRLQALYNAYQGQRCFIIGNGPSLKNTDLSLLKDEVTFGLNRIYLLFDEMGFTTTFLVSVNDHVIDQFREEILSQPMPKFLTWRSRDAVSTVRDDVTFVIPTGTPAFSEDPLNGTWEGATVTFVVMQLAYFMGFEEVILVGVDHSFVTQGDPHKLVTTQGADPNHFSPNYFGNGVRWQLPDLDASEFAYGLAGTAYRKANRSILDATVGGKLKVFPKRELKELFS